MINKMTVLLVVNNMLNVISLITVNPSVVQYRNQIAHRHIIIYTANIIHRIIIWQLTYLLNKLLQISHWILEYKKYLMSCTVCFYFIEQRVKTEQRKKKTRYNN